MQQDQAAHKELIGQLERTEGYLQADPGNTDLLARAIDLSLSAGDIERAEKHAQAALARYPDDAFFQYRWAHVLSAQQKWSEAEPLFAALLAERRDVNIAYGLANCQLRQQRYAAALETLLGYGEDPELPAAAVSLMVRALHHVGDLDQAVALVERHHERLAADATFLAAGSLVYLDQGDVAQAAALSNAALASGARPLEALVVGASLSLAHTDSERAIAQFKEVLAIKPDEGRSWSGLGMASLLNRDLAGAASQLEHAVKLLPGHIGTWHTLAWCKIFGNDLPGAEAAFRTALALDRNFGETHGGLAVVAALRGERSAAQASIERALGLDADSLSARYAQMVLAGETADPERFRALAMRVMRGRKTAFGENLADVVKRSAER